MVEPALEPEERSKCHAIQQELAERREHRLKGNLADATRFRLLALALLALLRLRTVTNHEVPE